MTVKYKYNNLWDVFQQSYPSNNVLLATSWYFYSCRGPLSFCVCCNFGDHCDCLVCHSHHSLWNCILHIGFCRLHYKDWILRMPFLSHCAVLLCNYIIQLYAPSYKPEGRLYLRRTLLYVNLRNSFVESLEEIRINCENIAIQIVKKHVFSTVTAISMQVV